MGRERRGSAVRPSLLDGDLERDLCHDLFAILPPGEFEQATRTNGLFHQRGGSKHCGVHLVGEKNRHHRCDTWNGNCLSNLRHGSPVD